MSAIRSRCLLSRMALVRLIPRMPCAALVTMSSTHAFYDFPTADKSANNVGGKHALNAIRMQILHTALRKQNPCAVDQYSQVATLLIQLPKQVNHLRFISNIGLHSKGISSPRFNFSHYLLRLSPTLTIVDRHPIIRLHLASVTNARSR